METKEKCISFLDTDYSYRFAKQMEEQKTNPVLGYRTAGSRAEALTGERILEEMKAIGLSQAEKDTFTLDGWEFKKAVLKFRDEDGEEHSFQMGGYQTDFHTQGFKEYPLMYLGKGTAKDYENKDVTDKLVLVDINQRDEWWISFPVYQAYLQGAAALIAVQTEGYGEADSQALNAQDIAGPDYAPAFSISQADAKILKEALTEQPDNTLSVLLDADSTVTKNVTAANITGYIPGQQKDSYILLSAHYDSYFDGFQDDNAAVSMMLGIARAIIKGGYTPTHTLIFCAMAAEEWGVIDSKYDWSTGAYNQVFRIHPQWQGNVVADLNFELPAHAHSLQDAVRCTYEYRDFMEDFIHTLTVPAEAYPQGITVLSPIETWSDDFSMAIAGIPSAVNDFSAGPFMQNYYHSQYDNEDVYQEPVYRFHHECYLKLIFALDSLVLPPLSFGNTLRAAAKSLSYPFSSKEDEESESLFSGLKSLLLSTAEQADSLYKKICRINEACVQLSPEEKTVFYERNKEASRELLLIFRKMQDYFVRLNWHDEVIFPQEAACRNIEELKKARQALKKGNVKEALSALYEVDNNRYAFLFDEEVYYHFTEYILHQPKERLMWGAGRIMHHENLYGIVQELKQQHREDTCSPAKGVRRVEAALRRQKAYFNDDLCYMTRAVRKISALLLEADKKL